jgi:peroxiredoxin
VDLTTPDAITYDIGYLKHQDKLKEQAGIDEILVFSVNDGAVMRAWGVHQNLTTVQDNMITFMGDPLSEVTRKLKMELLNDAVIHDKGLVNRCKRFALYVDSCVVKYVAVSESTDDPAGDADPSATCHEAMLQAIMEIQQREREAQAQAAVTVEATTAEAATAEEAATSNTTATSRAKVSA